MADPRTLLQRVSEPARPAGSDAEVLAASVRENLGRLFSTVQGSCQADLDYGLPDLSGLVRGLRTEIQRDLRQPDIEVFKTELWAAVSRFEPRLQVEELRADADPADPCRLRFVLRAQLRRGDVAVGPFEARAEVDPTGRLRVTR